jgi:pimeloyl-ACP methyl ester carboxylesterase
MLRRRVLFILLALTLLTLSCSLVTGIPTPTETSPLTEAPSTAAPTTETVTVPANNITDITPKLNELGGQPCAEVPDFTCVTLHVPLNHFDTSNTETIDVVFAVLPASGERYGMYVQAFPGGPGGEGISNAGVSWFNDSILQHFDIVYFDQRGVGLSSPLACPKAYAADFLHYLNEVDTQGAEGYDTPSEQQAAIDSARTFDESCVAEIGIDPAKLNFYGTDQVAEDIETFRQTIGDEKFWMYGVSYGTGVTETYAAAHADHLAGMILDGTQNLTLTGEEGAFSQEKAFDKVLQAVLKACDADQNCAADLGGDALSVYDNLAKQIAAQPIAYNYPLPSGDKIQRTFTFNQLEFTTAYQMYSLGGRRLFLRALAAAKQGDMVPMARLLYKQANLDPTTGAYVGDPTFSDTMFYDVLCTDDSFYGGTPEERVAKIIQAGQASNGTVPRLDGSVYTGLYCAYWPSAPKQAVHKQPLVAEGVPTLVLNATLDPATPFEEGKFVYEHLADGYHIYVDGGRHAIYGFGEQCPDSYVQNFLVNGQVPPQRETVCHWDPSVVSAYVPLMAKDVSAYQDPLQILTVTYVEIQLMPEYYYSYLKKDETVGCPNSGSFTFGPSDAGVSYQFDSCSFTNGFIMSGTGSYDFNSSVFSLNVDVSGVKKGSLAYTYNNTDGSIAVTGEYGGEQIDLKR